MSVSLHSLSVYLPLILMVGWAAVTDLRARRIPNWLSLTVMIAGIAQSLTTWGLITLGQSLCGLAAGFAVTFLLYVVGGRGAGDVKLTAGIGAWLGPVPILLVLAAAAIVSLLLVVVQTTVSGRLAVLIRNTGLMLLGLLNIRRLGAKHVFETGKGCQSIDRPLPNAVSMLIATTAVVVWMSGVVAG